MKGYLVKKADIKGASGAETFWDLSTALVGPGTTKSAFQTTYTYCEL